MDIYGILGFPVGHSLSPLLHNKAFKNLGINAEYDYFEISPDRLKYFFSNEVINLPIKGLSVTIPHKISCMEFLDEISESAQKIGAVNTIKNENNKLIGENFDWIGVRDSVLEEIDFKNKRVGICGAGGAARAATFAASHAACSELIIFVRDPQKHQKFATDFNCKVLNFPDLNSKAKSIEIDILINATPVGMYPEINLSPFNLDLLAGKPIIFDMVYKPLQTKMLQEAKAKGFKTITGEKMLLNQAYKQFEFWTGMPSPKEIMKKELLKNLQ